MNCRTSTRRCINLSYTGHELARNILFQCILSVLWVLTVCWCGYVNCRISFLPFYTVYWEYNTRICRPSRYCLRSLGRWDRGFESHSRHGYLVCVCVYSVFFFVVCLGSYLAMGWSLVQGVLPSVKMITELNKGLRPWMGLKSHCKKYLLNKYNKHECEDNSLTLSASKLYNFAQKSDWWNLNWKDLEGSSNVLVKALFWHLPGRTEEIHENSH
jgi:hypothetical protein